MKKRALSFFLLIVMLISLFPAQAFAVDVSAENPVLTAENPDPSEDKFEEVELRDMPEAEEETDGEPDPAEDPAAETVPEESDSVSSVMGEAVNGEEKNDENTGDDKEGNTDGDAQVVEGKAANISLVLSATYELTNTTAKIKAVITPSFTSKDNATYSYAWQYKGKNDSVWADMPDETADTLKVTELIVETCTDKSYRVKVTETTDSEKTVYCSDAFTLDVTEVQNLRNSCNHSDWYTNGTCWWCGYKCLHSNGYNQETHKCKTCGMDCPHKNWNGNTCSDCSTVCNHDGGWYTNSGMYQSCVKCGWICSDHDWDSTTGKCKICTKECEHSNWYTNGTCVTCKYACPHTGGTVGTKCSICNTCIHDWSNKNGKCAVEGCEGECETHKFVSTGTGCICAICGKSSTLWNGHFWENGVCKCCGEKYEVEISLDKTYLILAKNNTATLTPTVTPDIFDISSNDYDQGSTKGSPVIKWSAESGTENVISVAEGVITAKGVGTDYAVATIEFSDGRKFSANCRVDVVSDSEIEGVSLGTTSLTTELYNKDETKYAEFDVILNLTDKTDEKNDDETTSISGLTDGVQSLESNSLTQDGKDADNTAGSFEITAAKFNDETMNGLFKLVVLGGRRIRVLPIIEKEISNSEGTEIDISGFTKSSYSSKVVVTVGGKDYTSETNLKLTVKKTQPKLKASVGTFNSFYSGQSDTIEITGATVTAIKADTSKKAPVPAWLTLSEDGTGKLSINDEYGLAKSASGSVYLEVYTAEWAIPAYVTLTAKNVYSAPKLKLSASSAKFNTVKSEGVAMQLLPSVKGETYEQLNVKSLEVYTAKGVTPTYEVKSFDSLTGTFTLNALKGANAGKVTLIVGFGEGAKTVSLTLTTQIITPTIKLKKSSVTLNPKFSDSATVDMVITPADFLIIPEGDDKNVTADVTTSTKGADASDIKAVVTADGKLNVSVVNKEAFSRTYKVTVTIGSKKAVLTVTTLKKPVDPTATIKASGAIDLTFPGSEADITATVKNFSDVNEFTSYEGLVTVKNRGEKEGKAEDINNYFKVDQSGNVLKLTKKEDVTLNAGSTYTVTSITLKNGATDEAEKVSVTATNKVKITVKQTAVNLKLSKSSVSLNYLAGDAATINVTTSTKNYTLDNSKVDVTVADKTGRTPYTENVPLDVDYADGKLTVGVNRDTVHGTTYKVLISAEEGYKQHTLTVTVLSNKKDVTSSLKASGSIDVLRGGSKVTFTPTYKNVNTTNYTETVKIYSSADGYKTAHDPAELGFAVNGRVITNTEASTACKYKAQIVTMFNKGIVEEGQRYTIKSPMVSFTVKTGTAKMKVVGAPTLYQKDAYSRGEFSLTSTDLTLNDIAKVELKPSKTAGYFELHDYGNGQFAIGFKDDTISAAAKKLTTATVTLNIWHKGIDPDTAKPDATVSLKITLVK